MNKLLQEEINNIKSAGHVLGISDLSILEKDIFVTKAIHTICDMEHSAIKLVFCGGTCLTKAYRIVSRMSEDIDFKIFPAIPFASNSDRHKKLSNFRKELTAVLKNSSFEVIEKNSRTGDKNGYIIYQLHYPSHFEQHHGLRSHIQLEFTLALPRLPTTIKPIISLTDHAIFNDRSIEKNITCISILETAAEKWVALTRRISSIARGHDKVDETLVRHLYDIQAITKHVDLTNDFFALVSDTIDRDRTKFKRHHEYSSDTTKEIKYSLEVLGSNPIWVENYNNFVKDMVFDKENPGFDNCYKKLYNITEQILSQLHLQPTLTLDKRNNISFALTPPVMKQLKLYIKMQLRLTNLCNEKNKTISNPEKSQLLLDSAKTLNGRIRKLANDISKTPEIAKILSSLKPLEKTKQTRQAAIIHERFQKNEITIEDVNIVLHHIKHTSLKLSKEICYELKF